MAEKSLLIGDTEADRLVEYAALIARVGSADHVRLKALSPQGEAVVVDVLLNAGTVLVETTRSEFSDPDNAEAIATMRSRMAAYDVSVDFETDNPFGTEA
ncbi:MAG: hypothetical protein JWQ92_607 [Amnibacterium sp.]|nr:hypothetical protein [Amnibacterium sp.]